MKFKVTMKVLKLIPLLAILLISSTAFAQKGFEFGSSFQFQNTWMYNSEDNSEGAELDFDPTFNIAYGVNLGYGFHSRHGVRVGLFVSQQGQKYVTSEDYLRLPNANYQTETEYFQVPVLYRYNGRLDIANTSFLLTAGPQFGFLQSATSTVLSIDTINSTALISPKLDSKACFKAMDISAHLGLGFLARFTPKFHMNAMLNFNYSLQNIETAPKPSIVREGTRNAVVGINVSFFWLIGGPEMAGPPKMK